MQSCAGKIENETALRATIAAIARSIKVECSQRAPPEWIIFSDVYLTGDVNWLKVNVDPSSREVFSYETQIVNRDVLVP